VILPLGADGGHADTKPKYFKFPLYEGGSMTGQGKIIRHTFVGFNNKKTSCGSS